MPSIAGRIGRRLFREKEPFIHLFLTARSFAREVLQVKKLLFAGRLSSIVMRSSVVFVWTYLYLIYLDVI